MGGRKKGELKLSEGLGGYYFPKCLYIKRIWFRNSIETGIRTLEIWGREYTVQLKR